MIDLLCILVTTLAVCGLYTVLHELEVMWE